MTEPTFTYNVTTTIFRIKKFYPPFTITDKLKRVMKNKVKDWIDNSKTYRYKTYLTSKELRELAKLLKSN